VRPGAGSKAARPIVWSKKKPTRINRVGR